jgi:hypothetical protein
MAQTFFGYILRAWSQSQVQHCVAQTFFYQQEELIIFRVNISCTILTSWMPVRCYK